MRIKTNYNHLSDVVLVDGIGREQPQGGHRQAPTEESKPAAKITVSSV